MGRSASRLDLMVRLQALREQSIALQWHLTSLFEQRAVMQEERRCLTAEYDLLLHDAPGTAATVLRQEQILIQEQRALDQEVVRLTAVLRQVRQERLAILAEQVLSLKDAVREPQAATRLVPAVGDRRDGRVTGPRATARHE